MSLSKYIDLLSRRSLWFSRLDTFRDLYETQAPGAIDSGGRSANDYFDWDAGGPIVFNGSISRPGYMPGADATFVSCWCEGTHESAAMWDSYVRGEEGVAITTTVGRLRDTLKRVQKPWSIGRVRYVALDDVSRAPDKWRQRFFNKLECYEAENEIRAVIWPDSVFRSEASEGQPVGLGVEIEDPAALITSVHVPPRATRVAIRAVEVITHQFGLDLPVQNSLILHRDDANGTPQ